MTHSFDQAYWDRHWNDRTAGESLPVNPHLVSEVGPLEPGSALDAGCGSGAEAIWLAARGWQTTGADIAQQVLDEAARRAEPTGVTVTWLCADLSSWQPEQPFDLVTTHYAHPSIPQLDFYQRIAGWVAPGGTLLIVGHLTGHGDRGALRHSHGHDDQHDGQLDSGHDSGHGHKHEQPPAEAQVRAADITARLGADQWRIETAKESGRAVTGAGGELHLHDVVVRATRLG